MKIIDVSIIIVNYNSSKLVNDCIRSIFDKTEGVSYEIIVVDNATENLKDNLDYSEDRRVKLLQLNDNIGFGRANNAGAELAVGRYLFLLNPDTILINNAIKELVDFMDKNDKIGVAGCNLYDAELMPTSSHRKYYPGIFWELDDFFLNKLENIFYSNSKFNNISNPIEVKYVVGAALMIRNSDFKKLNGFDDEFFMYFEETDLCYRIRKQLKKNIYNVPSAKIIHLEGATSGGHNYYIFKSTKNYWENSRRKFLEKNSTVITKHVSNLILRINFWLKSKVLRDKNIKMTYKDALKTHLDAWDNTK